MKVDHRLAAGADQLHAVLGGLPTGGIARKGVVAALRGLDGVVRA